jgi:hypothetical protein
MWKKCLIAILATAVCAPGQPTKVYERGVIVNIQEDTSSSLYQGTSHTEYFENYWIRVGDIVYKSWCRDRLLHGCDIGFTIGDGVDVRFEKSSMFLKRSNEKEQKTNIEKRIKVNSQTDDALSQAKVGLPNTTEMRSGDTTTVVEQQNDGKVTVSSVPEDSEISVDKESVGNSPATVRLSAGKHTITVSSDGFKPWVREIAILPGSELTLNAKLESGISGGDTTGTAPVQPGPAPEQALHGPDALMNLPKEWTFAGGNFSVNIEMKGDYLFEHQDHRMKDGRRRQEDCETKKDGDRWVGKCHDMIWPKEGGSSPECSWELDEVITSVSPLQITGESQESLPPRKGKLCPTPANSMVKFVNVPKN